MRGKPVLDVMLVVLLISICGGSALGAIAMLIAPEALGPW